MEDDGAREFMRLFCGNLRFGLYTALSFFYGFSHKRSHEELVALIIQHNLATDRLTAENFIEKIATGEQIGRSESSSFRLTKAASPQGQAGYSMSLGWLD